MRSFRFRQDTGYQAKVLYAIFGRPNFDKLLQAPELRDYIEFGRVDDRNVYSAREDRRIKHISREVSQEQSHLDDKCV